eukprot:9995600-Karenia_brevis.AAC.1
MLLKNTNRQWADVQTNSPDSPVFGWQEGKVKEALNNLQRGAATARTISYVPFTYKDIDPWFFKEVMVAIVGTHEEFGILWGGATRT